MATAVLPQLTSRARGSISRHFRRLLAAASDDAAEFTRTFCIELIAATIYSPQDVQRRAGIAFLLLLDALNDRRTPESRELRWRRFIRLLTQLAEDTHAAFLKDLAHENADLL